MEMNKADGINKVAIIGAGTMGPGMAAVFAAHSYETRLMDIKPDVLEKARGAVEVVYQTLVDEGFLSREAASQGRERLTFTTSQEEAVKDADLVVEAIPEQRPLKETFYREVESQVRDETVLASNTSGIPISELCAFCRNPERVVGMHWSNPPHIIPVIEVIRGDRTADRAVQLTTSVVASIGMIPVVIRRDVPGFVENRILYAIMREALNLLEEGVATPEDIDTVTKWGIGFKLSVIGPLELLDMAGLDIYSSVASYLNADLSASDEVSKVITERVERGDLGIKTGRGLFEYRPDEIPQIMRRRMRGLLAAKKALMASDESSKSAAPDAGS